MRILLWIIFTLSQTIYLRKKSHHRLTLAELETKKSHRHAKSKMWPISSSQYDEEYDIPQCNCSAHCIVVPRTPDEVDGNVNTKCAMAAGTGLNPDAQCTRINDPIIATVVKLIARFCFYECQPLGIMVTEEKVEEAAKDPLGYHGGTLENTPCTLIELDAGGDGNGSDLSNAGMP